MDAVRAIFSAVQYEDFDFTNSIDGIDDTIDETGPIDLDPIDTVDGDVVDVCEDPVVEDVDVSESPIDADVENVDVNEGPIDSDNIAVGDDGGGVESGLIGRVQEWVEWTWNGMCAAAERVTEVVIPIFNDALDWVLENQETVMFAGVCVLAGSILTIIVANIIGKSPGITV